MLADQDEGAERSGDEGGDQPINQRWRASSGPWLERPDPRVAVQQQAAAVPGDRDVLAVGEAEDHATGSYVDSHGAVSEVDQVGHAVDDHRCAGNGASDVDGPEQTSASCGRDAVEDAVVRAEDDASGPDRRGRVDVRPRPERPQPRSGGREGGDRPSGRRRDEQPPAVDGRRPVDASVYLAPPAQPSRARVDGRRICPPDVPTKAVLP